MDIESIRHKALRAFAESGQAKGLAGDLVPRLRNMLAYLSAIRSVDELVIPPNYGAHLLSGDRKGVWSLTLTRMTFRVNEEGAIEDLDLEDYH